MKHDDKIEKALNEFSRDVRKLLDDHVEHAMARAREIALEQIREQLTGGGHAGC